MQVHKFGGTCVSAAERIAAAAEMIAKEEAPQTMVVVSAMGSHPSSPIKVTDLLLNMVARAAKQDPAFLIDLAALQVPAFVKLVAFVRTSLRRDGGRLIHRPRASSSVPTCVHGCGPVRQQFLTGMLCFVEPCASCLAAPPEAVTRLGHEGIVTLLEASWQRRVD